MEEKKGFITFGKQKNLYKIWRKTFIYKICRKCFYIKSGITRDVTKNSEKIMNFHIKFGEKEVLYKITRKRQQKSII